MHRGISLCLGLGKVSYIGYKNMNYKKKVVKLNFIKIKNLYFSKDTVKEM